MVSAAHPIEKRTFSTEVGMSVARLGHRSSVLRALLIDVETEPQPPTETELLLLLRPMVPRALDVAEQSPATSIADAARLAKETLMEWVADGRIRPHVGLVLPLERIGEAIAAIGGRTSSGRVVMKVK